MKPRSLCLNARAHLALLPGWLACLSAQGGYIVGSFSPVPSGSNVNLSTVGKLDWIHWGLYTSSSRDRKWGVLPQISDYTVLNGDLGGSAIIYQYANNANGYTWTDGWPHESVTNTTTGVWAYQSVPNTTITGFGFQFTAPADTAERILQVYVGAYAARGKLQASLSDASATNYVDTSLFNSGNGPGAVYTLRYKADSAGQTLSVNWTLSARGTPPSTTANVTLQAAALTASNANNPPLVTVFDPANQSAFAAPAAVSLSASALDFDGTVTNVAFYAGLSKLGEVAASPYNLVWSNVTSGRYMVTAAATDNGGVTRASPPIEVFVHGSGGSLTGSNAAAPATVDLTAEGTADWTHWGLVNSTSFDYKGAVPRQISNFTKLGTNSVKRYSDNYTAFAWSDGTPTTDSFGTTTGVYVNGLTNGFSLTAPADTNARTLRVYLGGYGSEVSFTSWLSDLSAAPYTDSSISNVYGSDYLVYTLNYAAASAGQTLEVVCRIQDLFDYDYGNVTLPAATLQGPLPAAPSLTILNPQLSGGEFSFSFNSQSNQGYTVEFTPLLSPANWLTLTNLIGTGGELWVADPTVTNAQRYYRLIAQ